MFAKACRCLCFTVQLLKAAWILTSCSRDKESMKKIQLTGWFCLLQIDGLAGCRGEYQFISSPGDPEA